MGTNQVVDFNRWVNDHNPAENLSYGKGWWDYIEIIRRLAGKFDIEDRDIQVVSTYLMKTPPPCEELLMPVLRLNTPNIQFTIKYDSGSMDCQCAIQYGHSANHTGPVRSQPRPKDESDCWLQERMDLRTPQRKWTPIHLRRTR